MKGSTVDLIVTGGEGAVVAAAVDAVRRGQRVLVVLRSGGQRLVPRLRRLCRAAKGQLTVMTEAEVVCVDGVGGVEAVVVRYTRTGRLCAANTPAFLSCDGSKSNHCGGRARLRSIASDHEGMVTLSRGGWADLGDTMTIPNQAATLGQQSRRYEDDQHAERQQSATSRIEVRADAVPRHSGGPAQTDFKRKRQCQP
jgi:hypothetical protein